MSISPLNSLGDDDLIRRLQALASGTGNGGLSAARLGPALHDGVVIFDSSVGGGEAMRSGTSDQRQLVVQAADARVVFDIDPIDERSAMITGQVIGVDLPAAVQVLGTDNREAALSVTDDDGNFSLIAPLERVEVIVATDAVEIVAQIDLWAR